MLDFLEINLSKKYVVLRDRRRRRIPIKGGRILLDLNRKKLDISVDFGKRSEE